MADSVQAAIRRARQSAARRARGPARPARSSAQRPIGDQHVSARGRIGRHRHFSRATAARPAPVVPGRGPRSDDGRRRARAAQTSPHVSAVNPTMPPKPDLRAAWVSFASAVTGVAQAGLRTAGIAGYLGPTQSNAEPDPRLQRVPAGSVLIHRTGHLVLRSVDVLAGRPTLMGGSSKYSVMDPVTKASAGNFDALVSTGSPFNVRSKYVELLVTANDGTTSALEAGQLPPVGSLISSFHLIRRSSGWSYSPCPHSRVTRRVVAFALLTRSATSGSVQVQRGNGIADHTVDNRPVRPGSRLQHRAPSPVQPPHWIHRRTTQPFQAEVRGLRPVRQHRGEFRVPHPTTDGGGRSIPKPHPQYFVRSPANCLGLLAAGVVLPVGSVFQRHVLPRHGCRVARPLRCLALR